VCVCADGCSWCRACNPNSAEPKPTYVVATLNLQPVNTVTVRWALPVVLAASPRQCVQLTGYPGGYIRAFCKGDEQFFVTSFLPEGTEASFDVSIAYPSGQSACTRSDSVKILPVSRWIGSAGSSFMNPAMWSPPGIPNENSALVIDSGAASLSQSVSVSVLFLTGLSNITGVVDGTPPTIVVNQHLSMGSNVRWLGSGFLVAHAALTAVRSFGASKSFWSAVFGHLALMGTGLDHGLSHCNVGPENSLVVIPDAAFGAQFAIHVEVSFGGTLFVTSGATLSFTVSAALEGSLFGGQQSQLLIEARDSEETQPSLLLPRAFEVPLLAVYVPVRYGADFLRLLSLQSLVIGSKGQLSAIGRLDVVVMSYLQLSASSSPLTFTNLVFNGSAIDGDGANLGSAALVSHKAVTLRAVSTWTASNGGSFTNRGSLILANRTDFLLPFTSTGELVVNASVFLRKTTSIRGTLRLLPRQSALLAAQTDLRASAVTGGGAIIIDATTVIDFTAITAVTMTIVRAVPCPVYAVASLVLLLLLLLLLHRTCPVTFDSTAKSLKWICSRSWFVPSRVSERIGRG
jgi:hypothetical protein